MRRYVVSLCGLAAICALAANAMAQVPASDKERELIAVLTSDAPKAEKAITCKFLAVYGSSAAVPELAKLLPDEQLSSWARIALEAIPGPEADAALREASKTVEGRLLVGVINSIAVRRDAGAVELLTDRLEDADAQVASSAAVALGKIGNDAATKTLRDVLANGAAAIRSAVAEGCVLCAERALADGRSAEAVAIYDEVRAAEVARTRLLEATRGAILARGQEGIPLLVEQLRAPDKGLFQIALFTAREFPGNQVDEALAGELRSARPERGALIVEAMADRKETVVLAAVRGAATDGARPVRLAAISALGRVGDTSCLAPLLDITAEGDEELAAAAKKALAELPGANVDRDIVALLPSAEGQKYLALIELVGQRRIAALEPLLEAVDHADKEVRAAALTSLGSTVPQEKLSVLIAQVTSPKHADDAPVAQLALKTAAVRMADREKCAADLAAALDRAPVATKLVLLDIVGAVGGTKALQTVVAAAKTNNDQLQDASTRLLGEWMTADVAPPLLDLAKVRPGDKYTVRAMRAYIRVARQFVMPEEERLAMCKSALEAARQPAERTLVLEVLQRYPSLDMLKLAVDVMQRFPEQKEEATQAMLVIAQKLGDKGDEVTELLSKAGLEKVKVEIIKAEYGAGETQRDVTDILKNQVGDLQLVPLPRPSYNASFGGDPVPDTPKQLKVQYRINGKEGEATFAENALIILPVPK
jgi:HEAT repeat protein